MVNTFTILMAEDNEHDIVATKRAWKKNKITNPLYIVNDGEECLDYLFRRGKYEDPASSPKPKLLLLDINMPRMGGFDVLRRIRDSGEYQNLPVIVLTTSSAEKDIFESYNLKANAYVVKPVGFDNFAEAIHSINLFWQIVELPGENSESD